MNRRWNLGDYSDASNSARKLCMLNGGEPSDGIAHEGFRG